MTKEQALELWTPYFNRVVVQPNGCHYIKGLSRRPTIRDNKIGQAVKTARIVALVENLISEEDFVNSAILICHKCDDELCVNPDDLYVGDKSSNAINIVSSGQHHKKLITHCPHGHEYTPENIVWRHGNKRVCKACMHNYQKTYTRKR